MFSHLKVAILGLACLVLLPTTAVAAAPPPPSYAGVTSGTAAQLQALVAKLPAPTPRQLAIAQALLAKPFQGTIAVQAAPTSPITPLSTSIRVGVTPYVSVQIGWTSITVRFTQADIHDLWRTIFEAGIGAVAAILCAPAGWVAVGCAVLGAAFGWFIAEVIWYYIGYYVPSCGVHVTYYWSGQWSWGNC
jgi:enamine deaminase RidA (YjgF/YER057c/UK114 family)